MAMEGNRKAAASLPYSLEIDINSDPLTHECEGVLSISGVLTTDRHLTVDNNLANVDGLVEYQWQADGVAIEGETNTTLLLSQELAGKSIRVVADYLDIHGHFLSVSSEPTFEIATPVAYDYRVNTNDELYQADSSITSLVDGGWVIVWWSSESSLGSTKSINAQRYNDQGMRVGTEFRVDTGAFASQVVTSVNPSIDGGWVVVWQVDRTDGFGFDIFAQRYDSDSNTVGSEICLNNSTKYQNETFLTILNDGNWVVTWKEVNQDKTATDVYAQSYDSEGSISGSAFKVNTVSPQNLSIGGITPLDDGGWVTTWDTLKWTDLDTRVKGIQGQRFDAQGNPVGGEFTISPSVENSKESDSIVALSDGGWLITWSSQIQDNSDLDVFSQRYDASSNPVGDPGQTHERFLTSIGQ